MTGATAFTTTGKSSSDIKSVNVELVKLPGVFGLELHIGVGVTSEEVSVSMLDLGDITT